MASYKSKHTGDAIEEIFDSIVNKNYLNNFSENNKGELLYNRQTIEEGEQGNQGRSIISIIVETDNNVKVTYSDGNVQIIGRLHPNVLADFLVLNGYGGIRYNNNSIQYHDTETNSWINVQYVSSNPLVVELTPHPMEEFTLTYDSVLKKNKFTFVESKDTVLNEQALCIIEGVKFIRKKDSEPIDINDGTLVLNIHRKDFGLYKDTYFIDRSLTPKEGEIYYYKAFPYSVSGVYLNSFVNTRIITF